MGWGCDVLEGWRQLAVSGGGFGSAFSAGAGVGSGKESRPGVDVEGSESSGVEASEDLRADLSLGSGSRVLGICVPSPLGGSGDYSEHEAAAGDWRQRVYRVVLPLDEGGGDPRPGFPPRSRSARGRCTVHPSLQPDATPLVVGLSFAHRLRKDRGLRINAWSVNKIGS